LFFTDRLLVRKRQMSDEVNGREGKPGMRLETFFNASSLFSSNGWRN
jgi:hypothetical protein